MLVRPGGSLHEVTKKLTRFAGTDRNRGPAGCQETGNAERTYQPSINDLSTR
jgi:hypothetical protein